MDKDELKRREGLTFSQAEGHADLPQQLQLRELSRQLRAALWKHIFSDIRLAYGDVVDPWRTILFDYCVDIEHGMASEFEPDYKAWVAALQEIFEEASYDRVLTFVQFVVQHEKCRVPVRHSIVWEMQRCGAAYRFMGDRPTLYPVSDDITAQATANALKTLASHGMQAARTHLRKAAEELTANHPRDSIRESIHAVESVAKTISEKASASLGPALDAIAKKHPLHGALKGAFDQLYGYTSDEKGIRHALIDDIDDKVGENEALFMFTSCAAFCAYLSAFA